MMLYITLQTDSRSEQIMDFGVCYFSFFFSRHIWGCVRHSLQNGYVAGRNSREDEGEGGTWERQRTWQKQRACRDFSEWLHLKRRTTAVRIIIRTWSEAFSLFVDRVLAKPWHLMKNVELLCHSYEDVQPLSASDNLNPFLKKNKKTSYSKWCFFYFTPDYLDSWLHPKINKPKYVFDLHFYVSQSWHLDFFGFKLNKLYICPKKS